ncbi:MAG: LPS assembly protein LptD [Planctomycetota bacterium]
MRLDTAAIGEHRYTPVVHQGDDEHGRNGGIDRRLGVLRAAWWCVTVWAVLFVLGTPSSSWADAPFPVPPLDSPFAGPVLEDDAVLLAARAVAWREDGVRYVRLNDAVQLRVGHFIIDGDSALVRIDRQDPAVRDIKHLAVVIDRATTRDGRGSGRAGATRAEAERLLVTVRTSGGVRLKTDLLQPIDAAPPDRFVQEATARIDRYFEALGRPTLSAPRAALQAPASLARRAERRAEVAEARAGETLLPELDLPREQRDRLADQTAERQVDAETVPEAIIPTRGTVYYDTAGFAFRFAPDADGGGGGGGGGGGVDGPREDALILLGPARLAYQDYQTNRTVTLKAQRMVVYFDRDGESQPLSPQQVGSEQITGIYLEDNAVVSSGDYTVRSPRVFYDLKNNRAILLEAVLYTWDPELRVPLYARAEVLRQTAADRFEGERALLTTSEFAEPHLAIGASRFTASSKRLSSGRDGLGFSAEGVTLQSQGLPFFYWPVLSGAGRDVPLRRVRVGSASNSGVEVETRWDTFALLGREAPEGVSLESLIDYRGEHGLGVGLDLRYTRPEYGGRALAYLLPQDDGDDEPGGRSAIDQDGDTRGFFQIQHRQRLPGGFDLSLEGAYVSDETFLEEFYERLAYEAKPFETSAYLRKQEDDWAFTAYVGGNTNDFLPQLAPLSSPGYTVDRLPELNYLVTGRSLLDDRVTYFADYSVSRVRARFGDDTPADRGFTEAQAQELFGIGANTAFRDRFPGFPTDYRTRIDTRQELSAPTRLGPLDVTVFAVGRATGYDDDFAEFNGGNNDQYRLYGQTGLRVGTELHRTYDLAHPLLDLDGLRHVITPQVTAVYGDATLASESLPTFDADIEDLAEGGIFRIGLTNTLQTRRGGLGRTRTVDWIRLQTDAVFRTDNGNEVDGVVLPRYFDYRPELTVGGDHFYSQLLWMVSDTLGVSGDLTHSFESDDLVQWRVAAELERSPRLTLYVGYGEIEPLDSELLSYGLSYKLTSKYRIGVSQTLELNADESRTIELALERRFSRYRFQVTASFDDIDDEQTVGIVFIPEGLTNRLGSSVFDGLGTN